MFKRTIDNSRMPQHVAFIMDGNGRWAKRHGLPRIEGHRRGLGRIKEIIRAASDYGIRYLTFYAFSTENWKRPKDEVDFLMSACERFISDELPMLLKNGIRLKHIGSADGLPESLKNTIARACELTRGNKTICVQLAFNYGSRAEIVDAVKKVSGAVKCGDLALDSIGEECIARSLYTAGTPDPDLLVRTSGEMRISNFLLWQLCYAEFFVTPVCWPDFGKRDFLKALSAYQKRSRRFGGIDD